MNAHGSQPAASSRATKRHGWLRLTVEKIRTRLLMQLIRVDKLRSERSREESRSHRNHSVSHHLLRLGSRVGSHERPCRSDKSGL
eukprot:5356038-Prymnesium_polylepis.1